MRHAFFSFVLFAGLPVLMARADDLVTRDGTVYHDYKVLSHDTGYLTIMYSDGGGKIPLSNLPDALQKQYGYDKQAADAAVQAAVAQDRQARQAIANEEEQRQQEMAARAQVASVAAIPAPAPAPEAASTPADPSVAAAPAPAASAPAPAAAPDTTAPTGDTSDPSGSLAPPDDSSELTPLQQKILDCEVNIHSLKVERAHEKNQHMGEDFTHGAYDDKIAEAQAELSDLNKQKRAADREASRKAKPRLTPDQVASIQQEILQIKIEISKLQSDVGAESAVLLNDGNSHGGSYAKIIEDQMRIDTLTSEIN